MARAFLETYGGLWLDEFVYSSVSPLRDRGIEVISGDETVLDDYDLRKGKDFFFGSVEFCQKGFRLMGLDPSLYESFDWHSIFADSIFYNPKDPLLKGYYNEVTDRRDNIPRSIFGRNIWKGRLSDKVEFPHFVKPLNTKQFTGFLAEKPSHYELMCHDIPGETEVLYSEVMEFTSEYRCFIHDDKIVGLKHYLGDFFIGPSDHLCKSNDREPLEGFLTRVISKMRDELNQETPKAYTIDIGYTPREFSVYMGGYHKTEMIETPRVIELNDIWATGSYGLDGRTYVRMNIDRQLQLHQMK